MWLCVFCVGQLGNESAAADFVLCLWDSLVSECAAGGFVVCVGQLG